MPFMTKDLSKKINARSRFNFLKNRTEENKIGYTKQRNKWVSLLRSAKKKYYGNLDEKKVINNKQFWKTINTFNLRWITFKS